MKNFFYRVLCGFFMGISVFAPGVSGSVMAIIMGIYGKLIEIISNPLKKLKQNIIYLIPMGIGAVISLILFVLVFSYLFETYQKATYLLFIGLIAGNIPMVFKDANKGGFKKHYIIGIIAAFALALTAGILGSSVAGSESAIYTTNLVYLGISGAIAGMASLIPGMSISMILMVLGVYNTLMAAARSLDFIIIAVVGVCFVAAMVASSHFIKYIFKRFHGFASFMVFGFMCGSLAGICFGLPADNTNFNWFAGVLMILLGLGISVFFVFFSKKLNPSDAAPASKSITSH